jgi:hypothetical protein
MCCINHHRPFVCNTATLLPVVYRIWLKNKTTMVDVDTLRLQISLIGLLTRRSLCSAPVLLA